MLLGLAAVAPAWAAEDHTVLTPQEVKWAPAPPSVPKGAEAAVLMGDPAKEGPFALRLRLPAGYAIPPHTHPKPEVVTVISGTFRLGSGGTADRGDTQALPAGSFFAFPPGMEHFVFTDEETVVQINSSGPWGIAYANPADDPRNQ
jgi:quercetin dioxygenase-like cupin family protein